MGENADLWWGVFVGEGVSGARGNRVTGGGGDLIHRIELCMVECTLIKVTTEYKFY